MTPIHRRFALALANVMEHTLDRRLLVMLLDAGREIRYLELHRAVGSPHKQEFAHSVERLTNHALLKRRLVPKGERHESHLSLSARGVVIAGYFARPPLPDEFPAEYEESMRKVLRGESVTA